MTYEALSKFAQQGGSIYFLVLFMVGLAYAAWPKNKDKFEHARRLPLNEEADHDGR
ncbi:MAG: cytochrome c oxidase, CcoQ subunit [Caulobacteraceae bacterium]|nr:cytochrome c oxidase, CcoQ subunit [Caulobacteraceae bacterium]